jgi:DNA-binding NarL/FixJ family response regulator
MPFPGILIVEDEGLLTLDIKATLNSFNLRTVGTCRTGEDAIRLVRRLQPDIVVMDIRLAGDMDGIEAARIIRKESKCRIIYLTAQTDPETVRRAEETNPVGVIAKPYRREILKAMIHLALGTSGDEIPAASDYSFSLKLPEHVLSPLCCVQRPMASTV